MANKPRKRRRTPVKKLRVSESLALGTLGAGSIVTDNFDDVVSEKMFLLSLEATWALGEHTPDQGAITVGVAHSDYSSTEITEWLAASGAWDLGDLVAREQNNRKIRQVGTFAGALAQETLKEGLYIKTPLRFIVETGQTLQSWAFNKDTSVLTTGSLVTIEGQVWAKSA